MADISSAYDTLALLHESPEVLVYRGRRKVDGRPVVLKTPRSPQPTAQLVKRLQHEYEIARQLDTPAIVRPYGLEMDHGRPVLVLEDFEGVSLDRLLGGPLEPERFLYLALRTVEALAELHRLHVVHKDLKPSNILVHSRTAEVKLADLEHASLLPGEHPAVRSPYLIEGTLPYMSPEQTGRMNRTLDYRTDFYSLGVTFYEMLTGRLPFQAKDPLEWVHCHVARLPRPPHELVPAIPAPLSALVLKLLAKAAEDRYQSTQGLRRDLERCLAQWQAEHRIIPFPLGEHDISERFQVSQRLYGRELEVAVLLQAFARVAATGTPELVLVRGYSGIGKSSLVNELHQPVVRERGTFLSGKFDQHQREVPYSTLVQSFHGRVQELLAEDGPARSAWRQRLQAALGASGQLVVQVLPLLQQLLGPQPPLGETQGSELQRQFQGAFRRFMQAFAQPGQPLVLFLDDLQWADLASLQLLQHVLTQPDTRHLLVVGAYRDNEVGPSHPLLQTLETITQAGTRVRYLTLGPLSPKHMAQLIADTVRSSPQHVEPLAELVHVKTAGNPFFASQFLRALYREHLIHFDPQSSSWRWEVERIRHQGFTDNVIELMAERLGSLPEATQEVVQLAACLGNQVEASTLALVSGRTEAQVHRDLLEAVREGLLLKRGECYLFVHDRVQQAAYLRIAPPQRARVHLHIGRALKAHTPPPELEPRLFDLVSQLNAGAELMETRAEREELAWLNLRAGRKAKASVAYRSARSYLTAGAALLEADCWQERYELAFALHLEQARCTWLSGDIAEAERLLAALRPRAHHRMDRAAVLELLAELHIARAQNEQAIHVGLECLRLYGLELPPHPSAEQVHQAYLQILQEVGERRLESLAQLPRMDSPEMQVLVRAARVFLVAAFYTDANLGDSLVCAMMGLTLRHGLTPPSAIACAAFSMGLLHRFGLREQSLRFSRLALEVVEQEGFQAAKAAVCNICIIGPEYWLRPIQSSIGLAEAGIHAGLEAGEQVYTSYVHVLSYTLRFLAGHPLEEVHRHLERSLDFVRRADLPYMYEVEKHIHHRICSLRGARSGCALSSGQGLELEAFEEKVARGLYGPSSLTAYFSFKLTVRFLLGHYEEVVADSERVRALLPLAAYMPPVADYHLYSALALAAVCDRASAEERGRYLELLRVHEARLRELAEGCAENFFHKHALVCAELARLGGEEQQAQLLYEQAIRSAREQGFVQGEGVGYELAAGHYQQRGFGLIATTYLREARACYARWGADAKVAQLEQHHPYLAERPQALPPTSTLSFRSELMDLLSVIKASQSHSSEMLLPRLLETLMQLMLEQAGAQRAGLLRVQGEELLLDAEAEVERGVWLLPSVPVSRHAERYPLAMLRQARRERQRVLLDDASRPSPFSEDAYIARHLPRSVLCLPVLRQSKLVGLLYLENNLVTGAFTPERLVVLELLASQAAISLENARLYTGLRQENAERQQAEQALRASQQQLQAIIDNSAAAISVKDLQGRILLANQLFRHSRGATGGQLLGRTEAELLPAEVAERVQEYDRTVLREDSPRVWEETVPGPEGPRVYLSVKFPLHDSEGRPYALCCISTDITERKEEERAERFLAEASRQMVRSLDYQTMLQQVARLAVPELAAQSVLWLLVEQEQGGTWRLEPVALAGALLGELEAARGLLGELWLGETGEGGRVGPAATEPEEARAVLAPVQEGGALARLGVHTALNVPLVARERYLGVLCLLATREQRLHEAAALELAEELGRRAALALDNARLYREAQQAISLRDEFLSVASHELKTPLTSLRLQAQAVERLVQRSQGAGIPPQSLGNMLGVFNRQLRRLGRLVEELLDVSVIQSGRLSLRRERLDMRALVEDVLERMAAQLEEAGCELRVEAPAPVEGEWDRFRLEQVVLNLLSNAMKYGRGRPVRVRVLAQGGQALLCVQDQGVGIASEDQERIFSRFERASPVRHHFEGLGLGLYISREVVRAHGGRILVKSEPGLGSVFTVELPLAA